jgi:Spy/CpxP family protein refolding chaperone
MKYLILSILAVLFVLPVSVQADPQYAPGQGADFDMLVDCGDGNGMDQSALTDEIAEIIVHTCEAAMPSEDELTSADREEILKLAVGATFKDTAEDIAADVGQRVAALNEFQNAIPGSNIEFADRSCQVHRVNPGSQTKIMCDTDNTSPSQYCALMDQETIDAIVALCNEAASAQ